MSLLKVNEVQNYNGSSLTLTASTVSTSAQLNTGGNISVTGSINVSDDSTTRSNLGLGSIATQNANAVAITGGTINTVQPATGQSLTIKDEDGNTAITVGTDNTAASYLSLNFGSYNGGSGTLEGNTLSDYETGTFQPIISGESSTGTGTYTYQLGNYVKIGSHVWCSGNVAITGHTGTGKILIQGIPFTMRSSGSGRTDVFTGTVGRVNTLNFTGQIMGIMFLAGSTTGRVVTASTGAAYGQVDMDTSFQIAFNVFYEVA